MHVCGVTHEVYDKANQKQKTVLWKEYECTMEKRETMKQKAKNRGLFKE